MEGKVDKMKEKMAATLATHCYIYSCCALTVFVPGWLQQRSGGSGCLPPLRPSPASPLLPLHFFPGSFLVSTPTNRERGNRVTVPTQLSAPAARVGRSAPVDLCTTERIRGDVTSGVAFFFAFLPFIGAVETIFFLFFSRYQFVLPNLSILGI